MDFYRIMYKFAGMPHFVSAVVYDDANDKLVEARYTSKDAAEADRQAWFCCDVDAAFDAESRVEKINPVAKCDYMILK